MDSSASDRRVVPTQRVKRSQVDSRRTREPVRYRRASLEDVPQIEEMEEEYFAEEAFGRRQIRYLIQSPNTIALTACSNSKVLGYIMGLGRRGSSVVRIYTFCVRKDYRRKGIGTSLLHRLERECQVWFRPQADKASKGGVFSLILEVGESNFAALKFYKDNGFVEFSRIPGYYTDGTTAIRMRKIIALPISVDSR